MGRWRCHLKGNKWEWFVRNRLLISKIKWGLCEFLNLQVVQKQRRMMLVTLLPVGGWRPVEDNKLFLLSIREIPNLPQVWNNLRCYRKSYSKIASLDSLSKAVAFLLQMWSTRETGYLAVAPVGLWSSVLSFQPSKRLAGSHTLPSIKMSLIFQTSPYILYIVLYPHPTDLWKQ